MNLLCVFLLKGHACAWTSRKKILKSHLLLHEHHTVHKECCATCYHSGAYTINILRRNWNWKSVRIWKPSSHHTALVATCDTNREKGELRNEWCKWREIVSWSIRSKTCRRVGNPWGRVRRSRLVQKPETNVYDGKGLKEPMAF